MSQPAMSSTARPEVATPLPWPAIATMFLLTGASGLIYEIVWTRQLITFFGSTLYGVATVLTAFMGGLALGSHLLGRRADSLRKPLLAYGAIEIAIGVAALAFPFVLRACQPIIGAFYATGGESNFHTYTAVRFVIVFALLMVPTTLMGATLPILGKTMTRSMASVGKSVGGLYALNTTGAVIGVFLAGFFFIGKFGVFGTTLIAVALNVIVGSIAMALGRNLIATEPEPVEAVPVKGEGEQLAPGTLKLVLASYALSGFVALAYQVCWTRSLIFSFERLKSTTYSFSGILVVFLTGLAIGSALMQAFVDRQRNLLRLYALLQALIGLGGAFSWFAIVRDWPSLVEVQDDGTLIFMNAVANVMTKTALAIALPTLLMGMAFPVVTKLVVGSLHRIGGDIARVYALNTLGAIAGSFAAGFILIPFLGITGTIALLSAVNLSLAAVLILANREMVSAQRSTYATIFVAAAGIILFRIGTSHGQFQRTQPDEKTVHYEEGAMATVSVLENASHDRMIYVDDVGVAGTDKIMLTDQKSLAHVPMVLLGGEATRTLSVGFGSGGASYSYTLYPSIKEIHTIEIAPEVLRAAPTLTDSNHGIIAPASLIREASNAGANRIEGFRHPIADYTHEPLPGFRTFDPRFHVLVDDARSYLRFTKLKYDVIATDCTDLRYKTNANLYDLEYFTLCREAITDRGLVVVWMPLAGLSDLAFRSALRTFQKVFPEMGVWYFTNQPTHYCLLIGGKGPVKIDYEAVRRAAAMPQISDDLEEIGLRDPDKLISSFVCDERTLTKHLADAPLNTENNPFIEFESPRHGYDSRPLRDNQQKLYAIQVPATPLLTNVPAGTSPGDRIWRFQQANEIAFRGHCEFRFHDFEKAAAFYLEAEKFAQDDDSIKRLLDFDELKRLLDGRASNPNLNAFWIAVKYARVMNMQNRYADAATMVEPFANMFEQGASPADDYRDVAFQLNAVLAETYAKAGKADRAKEFVIRATKFARDEAETNALRERIAAEATGKS